ncbi:MAG: hypothetical protein JSU63_11355 [Phycisphaerales bacterium]|nr:MAG: hypothetical protein JSU63_11355 [Phycisphaerales bacterium]
MDDGRDTDDGLADYAAICEADRSAYHGADGATGFAPAITGMGTDDLAAGSESPSHGSISLTDDEVAAIAEFLGG